MGSAYVNDISAPPAPLLELSSNIRIRFHRIVASSKSNGLEALGNHQLQRTLKNNVTRSPIPGSLPNLCSRFLIIIL